MPKHGNDYQKLVPGDVVYVSSTETEILGVSENDSIITKFDNFKKTDEFSDFPFVKKCDFATIYSKSKIDDWEIDDDVDTEDYDKDIVSKNTRIGICDSNDDWEPELTTIIVVNKDMKWYSRDGWTTDDMIYFKVNKKGFYSPASEPVDLIPDYENGGGTEVETKKILKKQVKQYNLEHLLFGA